MTMETGLYQRKPLLNIEVWNCNGKLQTRVTLIRKKKSKKSRMLLQGNASPPSKDRDDILGMMTEYQSINPQPSITQNSPNANLETAKYREMCKFYCSPYNVTTSNNTTWRYRRRVNHARNLKSLPKLVKFQEDIESGEFENMDAGVAVTKWSEKKFNRRSSKASSVTSRKTHDDRLSFTSETIRSTPTDSTCETMRSTPTDSNTSETNTSDRPSTKPQKSKKRVQFVGIDDKRTLPNTKGKKSKYPKPLLAANPYAYIKDEKTGQLPVIYEEKGVLPPIVEKYTTNVSLHHVRNVCIAGNKYQSAGMRWRSVYTKIRPTNHMKTFTEVVYAARAQMNALKLTKKAEMKAEDEDAGDGKLSRL